VRASTKLGKIPFLQNIAKQIEPQAKKKIKKTAEEHHILMATPNTYKHVLHNKQHHPKVLFSDFISVNHHTLFRYSPKWS